MELEFEKQWEALKWILAFEEERRAEVEVFEDESLVEERVIE